MKVKRENVNNVYDRHNSNRYGSIILFFGLMLVAILYLFASTNANASSVDNLDSSFSALENSSDAHNNYHDDLHDIYHGHKPFNDQHGYYDTNNATNNIYDNDNNYGAYQTSDQDIFNGNTDKINQQSTLNKAQKNAKYYNFKISNGALNKYSKLLKQIKINKKFVTVKQLYKTWMNKKNVYKYVFSVDNKRFNIILNQHDIYPAYYHKSLMYHHKLVKLNSNLFEYSKSGHRIKLLKKNQVLKFKGLLLKNGKSFIVLNNSRLISGNRYYSQLM